MIFRVRHYARRQTLNKADSNTNEIFEGFFLTMVSQKRTRA